MDDLKNGLRIIFFFKRDYESLPDGIRLALFSMYVTLASMFAQVTVDSILSAGYTMRLAGSVSGFVAGAVCYVCLSLLVRSKARLSIGLNSSYLVFTVLFTGIGVVGSMFI